MRHWMVLCALAALAGCSGNKQEQTKGASFGEVLPGSASDAMLPYDTATSAPPLDARTYEPDAGLGSGARRTSPTPDEAETVPDVTAT